MYFDIALQLKDAHHNVKVIRVEQLAPFPSSLIENEMAGVPSSAKVTWVQEESMNEGAF